MRVRSLSAAFTIIAVCALVGGLFGRAALSAQDQVPDQYKVFTAALKAVEDKYVGEYETDRLVYSAITGMLQTLDPHSSFMDPRSFAQMRERQEGRYYGLGITINVVQGDVTVFNVFEGSPAYQKGLRRGDVIVLIEGEATKGWNTEQAVRKLRGPKGTSVNIAVRRATYDEPIKLAVMRDEVHIPTVPAALMLDATTGYIKLQDFGENTDQELGRALRELTQKGMKRLVFDLRGNPGGALDQAIRVSNRFLPKGNLIVYTRGRVANSDQDYRATETSDFLNLPMVTLVSRTSASASEIVAGALQDHDRSLIVGETTFGKALVQSVYRLSQGAGAAITTARYYTPSGRMIQRPWDGTFDEYLTYIYRDQDGNKTHKESDLKLTDSGRKVYGGGGIEPDHFIPGPVEGFSPTPFSRMLASRNAFVGFSSKFAKEGDNRPGARSAAKYKVAAGWTVTPAMLADFRDFVSSAHLKFDEDAYKADEAFIKAMIHYEVDSDLFGAGEARRNLVRIDPQTQASLQYFDEAKKLIEKK